jgi:hypothetical protein
MLKAADRKTISETSAKIRKLTEAIEIPKSVDDEIRKRKTYTT